MKTLYQLVCGLAILTVLIGMNRCYGQDSLNMRCLSRIDYWQDAYGFQAVENTAYIVCGQSGLHIIDITDASQPVEIGWYLSSSAGSFFSGVYVAGNLAYLATNHGLVILDVSDPAHPIPRGEPFGSPICGILVHDGLAMGIAVDEETGFPVGYNVSNPDSVYSLGLDIPSFNRPSILVGMVGNYFGLCSVMGDRSVFSIFGLDSAQEFQPISEIELESYAYSGRTAGNYAYIASPMVGVSIIDVSNPFAPIYVGSCPSNGASDVDVMEGHAVIARNNTTLEIWNVTDPVNTFLEGSCVPGDFFYNVFVYGSAGYIECREGRVAFRVIDLTQPSAPVVAGSFGITGDISRIQVNGTTACLVDRKAGIRTIDLADPTHAVEIGLTNGLHAEAYDIALRNNLAYLASFYGLYVYDMTNPVQPESLMCVDPWTILEGITVAGDYAYVLQRDDGLITGHLLTIDLNSESLTCTSSLGGIYTSEGLTVINGYLYVGLFEGGFEIFDLIDPTAPELVGTYTLPFGQRQSDMAVEGMYVYLSIPGDAIQVIDISIPSQPVQVGRIAVNATKMAVNGTQMIAATTGRLIALDITDPATPITRGYYRSGGDVNDIYRQDSYILTTNGTQFSVYELDSVEATGSGEQATLNTYALYPCFPNPFNPSTQIRFSLPKADRVSLKVYNLLGQEVSTLIQGQVSAGLHTAVFDATDLPSGIYFYRLQSGTLVQSRKMILAK